MDKQENCSTIQRQYEADRAERADYINADEARKELALSPGAMAKLLLEPGCPAILMVDLDVSEELERRFNEDGGPRWMIPAPSKLYSEYKVCPVAGVANLAEGLSNYRLHKFDFEALKVALKPAGSVRQEKEMDSRSRTTYLKIIASLYAHIKKRSGSNDRVNSIAILSYKNSRYGAGSNQTKTQLAQSIEALTEEVGLRVGYRTVEKIMDEIQEVIAKQDGQ